MTEERIWVDLPTPAEQYMIQQEQKKQDAKLLRQLTQIRRTGEASRAVDELLTVNDLIKVSPPEGSFKYNHLKLTGHGLHTFWRLKACSTKR